MSGVQYSNESIGFHYYIADPDAITTIKKTYPLFMTEVSPGPPPTDDINHLNKMEELGISWISLEGKGDLNRMQNTILSQIHSSGHNWAVDSELSKSAEKFISM